MLAIVLALVEISGKTYIRFSAVAQENYDNAFNIDRAYLIAKHRLEGSPFSFRMTLDFKDFNDIGNSKLNGYEVAFLKHAYAQYSDGKLTVRFGLVQTPWIGFEEKVWEHRFVEKTFMDRLKLLSSADFGMFFKFKHAFLEAVGGIYNGEGYTSQEKDAHKDVSLRTTFRALEGMYISFYGHVSTAGLGYKDRFMGSFAVRSKLFNLMFNYSVYSEEGKYSNVFNVLALLKWKKVILWGRYDGDNYGLAGITYRFNEHLQASVNAKMKKDNPSIFNLNAEYRF